MSLVSIILPVYNSEKYISTCIESLLKQTYQNIEIIIVNDGSTDNTAKICENYKIKDSRIKFINKINGGICSARNEGLKYITGKYLMFCDHDDIYLDNTVEIMVNAIKSMKMDFVKCGIKYITIKNNRIINKKVKLCKKDVEYYKSEIINNYCYIKNSKLLVYVWNGIYSVSFIKNNNIIFDNKYKFGGEDADFNYKCLKYSKKIGFINKVLYVHNRRLEFSTAAKYDRNQIYSLYMNMDQEFNMINSISKYRKRKTIIYLIIEYFNDLVYILSKEKCNENYNYIFNVYKKFYNRIKIYNINIIDFLNVRKNVSYKHIIKAIFLKLKLFHILVLFTINHNTI